MSISEHSPDMRLRDSDVSFHDNGTNTKLRVTNWFLFRQAKSFTSEFVTGISGAMLYSNDDIITGEPRPNLDSLHSGAPLIWTRRKCPY